MHPIHALLALLLLAAVPGAVAQESDEDEVEPLSLAALLIGDGNHERARQVLAGVDPDDPELDRARYHTLSGLVALNLEENALAAREFEAAIDAGQTEPVVWLYLAQAYFSEKRYTETLDALVRAGPDTIRLPSVYLMWSQAHWELRQYRRAWDVLETGRHLFPDRAGDFVRRQVFLLVEQGLYQAAAELGRTYLEDGETGPEDALAIGNALRQTGSFEEAARILETARLQYPENARLAKVLAHTYLDQGQVLQAAGILRTAAVADPDLVSEAAELYRRAGWPVQALSLNGQVVDQSRKMRQRLAILIELERYSRAAAMEEDLYRVGLLDDEDILYALAYAWFKAGDFDRAESHLTRLTESELFRKATELRRVMAQCADEPWMCR